MENYDYYRLTAPPENAVKKFLKGQLLIEFIIEYPLA
jgi:hypothetical protein